MNRGALLWVGFVTVIFLVGLQLNILSTLFTVFVIGVIPGTTTTIPPWFMLLVYPALFCGTLFWLGRQTLMIGAVRPTQPKKAVGLKSRRISGIKKQTKTLAAAKRRARVAT